MASITWTGAAGDRLWSTAGNWNPPSVPGGADDVTIANAAGSAGAGQIIVIGARAAHTITISSNASVAQLVVENGGTLSVVTGATLSSGAIAVQTGGTLALDFNMTRASFAALQPGLVGQGGLIETAGTLDNSGSVPLTVPADITLGSIVEGGTWDTTAAPIAWLAGGPNNVAFVGTQTVLSGVFSIYNGISATQANGSTGQVSFLAGTSVNFVSPASFANETLNFTGSSILLSSTQGDYQITATGTLALSGTNTFNGNGADILNTGSLSVTGSAQAAADANFRVPVATSGAFQVNAEARVYFEADLNNTGTISDAGTLVFTVAPTSAGTIALFGAAAVVDVGFSGAGAFVATLTNFAAGDAVGLQMVPFADAPVLSVTGNEVRVTDNTTLELDAMLSGGAAGVFLAQAADGSTNLQRAVPQCFCAGTLIRTARGDVAVERLAVGDSVVALASGAPRLAALQWIGRLTVDLDTHPDPREAAPVRVVAGTFGPGRPSQDLILSPDHALAIDGVLVPVRHLLNGHSIRAEPAAGRVAYFHVELDRHDIVLANGLPSESYLETGGRAGFANGIATFRHQGSARPCLPLLTHGPNLAALWGRIYAGTLAAEAATAGISPQKRAISSAPEMPASRTQRSAAA